VIQEKESLTKAQQLLRQLGYKGDVLQASNSPESFLDDLEGTEKEQD
jgi:hypothetical protein